MIGLALTVLMADKGACLGKEAAGRKARHPCDLFKYPRSRRISSAQGGGIAFYVATYSTADSLSAVGNFYKNLLNANTEAMSARERKTFVAREGQFAVEGYFYYHRYGGVGSKDWIFMDATRDSYTVVVLHR